MSTPPDAIAALRAAPVPPSGPPSPTRLAAWLAAYARWWQEVRAPALFGAGEGT